jgi:hypothetical protein
MMTTAPSTFHLKNFILPFFLFTINFLAGILLINNGLFHVDAVFLAKAVEQTYQTGILQPAVNGRYGAVFVNSLLYFPFHLLGQNADFATRLSSVLFHALSIIALFYFVKILLKNRFQAFAAALLFSFLPLYFIPNTYGKEHGSCLFFLLLAFYAAQKSHHNNSWKLAAASGLLYAIAVTIRESVLPILPVFLTLFLLPTQTKQSPLGISKTQRIKLLLSMLIPLAIGLAAIYVFYLKPILSSQLNVLDPNAAGTFLGLFSRVQPLALKDLCNSTPFLTIASLAIAGFVKLLIDRKIHIGLWLFGWAMLFFYYANTKGYAPRYLDVAVIPIILLASAASGFIYKVRKWMAVALIIYCCLFMFSFSYPILSFRHVLNGEKEFALFIDSCTEKNAVLLATDEGPIIQYYGQRKFLYLPLYEPKSAIEDFLKKQIDRNLALGIPLYCTSDFSNKRYKKFLVEILAKDYNVTLVGSHWHEDYHRTELQLRLKNQKLYKVSRK